MTITLGAIIATATVGAVSYFAGKKKGHNECLSLCKEAILEAAVNNYAKNNNDKEA